MNFRRGHQVIVHDQRLRPLFGAPEAFRILPVWSEHPVADIMDDVATVANEVGGRLDALHFMAHGNRAYLQLGQEGITDRNVDVFRRLRDMVGTIVFFSCLVGQGTSWTPRHPFFFGQRVARETRAYVVAAEESQLYHNLNGVIDFGRWEGPVYVFHPGGSWDEYNLPNPLRRVQPRLNLERLIFGG